jgi:hypothetical protein
VTVALLGAIFSYAARQGIQPDNPVHGFAEGWRQRRLTDDEYRQVGMALSGQPAIDATWLIIMAGWRRGGLGLRWFGYRYHQDRRIAPPLVGIGRRGDVVFASRSGKTPIVGYHKMWLRIAKLGDLPGGHHAACPAAQAESRSAFSASSTRARSQRRASPEGRTAPRSRAIPQCVQPR